MECLFCGKEYENKSAKRRPRKYCSEECRRAYWSEHPELKNKNDKAFYGYNCEQCGVEFTAYGNKSRRYCSKECSLASQRILKGAIRTCVICNREYEPHYKGQRCCSITCSNKKGGAALKRTKAYECKNCGKEFIPKQPGRVTYCSRECAYEGRKAKPKGKVLSTCTICGKQFEKRLNSKCCSDECHKKAASIKSYECSKRLHELKIQTRKCKECGTEFTPKYGSKHRSFCSNECCIKSSRRDGKRKRRATMYNAFVEKVRLIDIYERDRHVCRLCGKKVNLIYKSPHPMSATLDHIIPLAHGGKHENKNAQLAHFICNSRKGVKAMGEQLRLY
jgi:uncharacterized OB-fold protein